MDKKETEFGYERTTMNTYRFKEKYINNVRNLRVKWR